MAKKSNRPEFSLKAFLQKIISHKTRRYARVWNTFNSIPDDILNSRQKIIIQSFMIFSGATDVLEALELSNKFQLPTGMIADQSGLTRYQTRAAIKSLPAAVEKLQKMEYFKYGESLVFKVYDENGTPIGKIDQNKTGESYYYIFEYQEPRSNKLSLKGYTDVSDESAIPKSYNDPSYRSDMDPFYAEKKKVLQQLNAYFPTNEHLNLVYFDLKDIEKAVKYYLLTVQEKTEEAEAKGDDINKVQLKYPWLKKCLDEKWYQSAVTPAMKLIDEIDYLKITFAKIRSFVTAEKINSDLILTHKDKPLHTVNEFNSIAGFYNQAYLAWNELDEEVKKEIFIIAGKYYRYARKAPIDKQDHKLLDSNDKKYKRLQQVISIMHTNFI